MGIYFDNNILGIRVLSINDGEYRVEHEFMPEDLKSDTNKDMLTKFSLNKDLIIQTLQTYVSTYGENKNKAELWLTRDNFKISDLLYDF